MEQTQAVSSPAEVADPFNGNTPTLAEYNEYRQSGELPIRFKPAEPPAEEAPADAPEETVESEADEAEIAPDSEPEEEVQEQPQKDSPAAKRIKQLIAEKKDLQRKLDAAAKPDAKPESSPAQPLTRAKPTAEDKAQDGTPKYKTYEEFVEDLADWKSEQQIARFKQEQAQQQALNAVKVTMEEARSRYEDADEVIIPAAQAINEAKIPQAVKQVFADSDLWADLCYVVGSDPDELEKFITLAQRNPRAAIGKVFDYEREIKAHYSKEAAEPKSGKAPEKRQTQAPKPPSPVGGSTSRAFDVSDESLSPEAWMRKRNEQIAKRKG